MQNWHLRFLGIGSIPGWLSEIEIEQFFTLTASEITKIRSRRDETLQLGLALHIGFLRMAGCALNGTDALPKRLLAFIGAQLNIKVPRVTSLRALYPRRRTLHEHQQLAQAVLGIRAQPPQAQSHLVAHMRQRVTGITQPDELLGVARAWLYDHRYLIIHERELLDLCRDVVRNDEKVLSRKINRQISDAKRKNWITALTAPHPAISGINRLDWLKRSPRSRRGQGLADAFERVQFLRGLGADRLDLPSLPLSVLKTYAGRVARLKLTRFARLRTISRDIGLPCFLQLRLWRTTDDAIDAWLMRVSEIRRLAMQRSNADAEIDWQQRHRRLLARVQALADQDSDSLPQAISAMIADETAPQLSRAHQARQTLLGMSAHVRRLLRLILALELHCASGSDWLNTALPLLRAAYERRHDRLERDVSLNFLPPLWRRHVPISSGERLRLLEAATMIQLQRGLRNGSVLVPASLSFCERDSLLIPRATWDQQRSAYLDQLAAGRTLSDATRHIVPDVIEGLNTLARAVRVGDVLVGDDGLRLSEPDQPQPASDDEHLCRRFAAHVGPTELPRLMMEIDSDARFSSALLRRPPKDDAELTALYGAILAHGMGLDRSQVRRMIPDVPDMTLQGMMAMLEEEGRLAEANSTVVQFMRRHPIVSEWGTPGLASSDMMSVETSRRLWNARVDPRTGSYAIGTYTHVLDQWGIAHDQPIVLNRRQAGAAIEGVLAQRLLPIDWLAVDTHGYTDVAMGLARLLGFELCPRLAMLRERKLYVPDGLYVPKRLRPVVVGIPLRTLRAQWDELLRLASSIREGWCQATQVLDRLGSDAQGDPLYQAASSFGRLVRTQYLCRYFADEPFRRSIRRVLNHGESVHQLQRTIHPYAIGPKRGRSRDEQRAISGSLALLSNLVMAWNTQKLQQLADLAAHRRPTLSVEDLAAIGPVATSHINFHGILHFPLKELGEPILRPPLRVSGIR